MEKLKIVFEIIGQITVLATLIAALTPSTSDDELVGKIKRILDKIISFLPTIGLNPATRELEHKLNEKK